MNPDLHSVLLGRHIRTLATCKEDYQRCQDYKYWAIFFTCRVSRAKHIELVEDMNSESFINALRGFKAILGAFQDDMRSQWKFVKKLADEFWRKWQLEYVHYLQTCRK